MFKDFLLVALGSALGGGLRYFVGRCWLGCVGGTFPLATFVVNMAGCLLIGALLGCSASGCLSRPLQLLLVTGFCGGLTTFSTFTSEHWQLWQQGELWAAVIYVGLSLLGGGLMLTLAYVLVRGCLSGGG